MLVVLGAASPFFPGTFFLENHQKTLQKQLVFEKNDG